MSVASRVQKAVWRASYGLASRRRAADGPGFMNYGYAPPDGDDGWPAALAGHPDRYGLALYHLVARAGDLAGRDVLEVGCGRGAGAAFVVDEHRPASMVAVDLSQRAIDLARAAHPRARLRFQRADAERLPFAAGSFDAVLNVESCHCYPDVPRFLAEAHRVLRPGGLLLLADVRHARVAPGDRRRLLAQQDIARLDAQLGASAFELLEREDVTAGVLDALRRDSARKRALIEARTPRPLRARAIELAAVEGTRMHAAFERGDETYVRYALRRP